MELVGTGHVLSGAGGHWTRVTSAFLNRGSSAHWGAAESCHWVRNIAGENHSFKLPGKIKQNQSF